MPSSSHTVERLSYFKHEREEGCLCVGVCLCARVWRAILSWEQLRDKWRSAKGLCCSPAEPRAMPVVLESQTWGVVNRSLMILSVNYCVKNKTQNSTSQSLKVMLCCLRAQPAPRRKCFVPLCSKKSPKISFSLCLVLFYRLCATSITVNYSCAF